MGIYVGKSGTKKEITSLYIGKNGTKKEVADAYYGKSGSVKKVYSAKAKPGQQVFTTSGTFTVPKGIKSIDVFCVGGGGGTSSGYYNAYQDFCVGGGGGGYTKTVTGVSVTPGQELNVIVGAGGFAGNSSTAGGKGGSTSVLSCSANGGDYGTSPDSSINGTSCGGSGGGYGGWVSENTSSSQWDGGKGGSDGSNGYYNTITEWSNFPVKYPTIESVNNIINNSSVSYAGQKSTTRSFGESSGTLYAGGGGGSFAWSPIYDNGYCAGGAGGGGNGGRSSTSSSKNGSAGTDNTGGGAGGGGYSGGSGIVIIRWS